MAKNKQPIQDQRHEGDPGRTADEDFVAGLKEQEAIDRVLDYLKSVQRSSDRMRDRIIRCRRNYASEFDRPKTKYTNRRKVFYPLTAEKIDGILPKLQVNDTALQVDPVEENDIRKAKIFQEILKFQAREQDVFANFNTEQVRQLLIDGTVVAKVHWDYKEKDDEVTTDTVAVDWIDVLDFYIDPLAASIEEAEAVAHKVIKPLREVKENPLYKNTEFLEGFYSISTTTDDKTETMGYDIDESTVDVDIKKVQIVEYWTNDRIITVATNLEFSDAVLLRDIENPFAQKMFAECWYEKRQNRWYGTGVAERLLNLQNWINQTVNLRIDNRMMILNKMFLKRRGANIDVRQFVSRPAGFIEVDDINADIKPLEYSDITANTFQDEQDINATADRLTSAFELTRGGGTPKTASEAVIQSEAAKGFFESKLGNIRHFFVNVFEMMAFLDKELLEEEMVLRITGDPEDFKEIDDRLGIPEEERKSKGKFRFIKLDDTDILEGNYDLKIDLDVSGTSRALKIKQLMDLLAIVAKDPQSGISKSEIYKELLKLWNFDPDRFVKDEEELEEQEMMKGQVPGMPGGLGQLQGRPNISGDQVQQQDTQALTNALQV